MELKTLPLTCRLLYTPYRAYSISLQPYSVTVTVAVTHVSHISSEILRPFTPFRPLALSVSGFCFCNMRAWFLFFFFRSCVHHYSTTQTCPGSCYLRGLEGAGRCQIVCRDYCHSLVVFDNQLGHGGRWLVATGWQLTAGGYKLLAVKWCKLTLSATCIHFCIKKVFATWSPKVCAAQGLSLHSVITWSSNLKQAPAAKCSLAVDVPVVEAF